MVAVLPAVLAALVLAGTGTAAASGAGPGAGVAPRVVAHAAAQQTPPGAPEGPEAPVPPVAGDGAGVPGPTGEPPGLPEPTADPDEVRREAERILRDEGFGREGTPTTSGGDLPEGEPGDRRPPRQQAELPRAPMFGGMGAVGQAIMWVLVVAVVAAAAWLVWRALRARSRKRSDEERDDEVHLEDRPADAIDRPADEWLALAVEAEAAGAWRDGLLYRYRSLVVALVDRGVIVPVVGRTVGEHRLDVAAAAPAAAEAFDEAAWLFERAWYGERPTGATERDRFVAMADDVLAAPVVGPGPAAGDATLVDAEAAGS